MNMMQYKGYLGTVEYSLEDHTLFGKLAFIRDLINYQAESIRELEQAFEQAVEDYLSDCKALNKLPDTPCKGSFNVRTGPDLHREAVLAAGELSLNAFVCEAIQEKIERSKTIDIGRDGIN